MVSTTVHKQAMALLGSTPGDGWQLEQLLGADALCWSYVGRRGADEVAVVSVLNEALRSESVWEERLVAAAETGSWVDSPSALPVQAIRAQAGQPALIVHHAPEHSETLATFMRRRRHTVPPAEALRLGAQLASLLACAHATGLVHGTLTPRHVLLGEHGNLMAYGFGLAPLQADAAHSIGRSHQDHDFRWLAPEVMDNAMPTRQADAWATGAITFALLTGDNPFTGRETPTDQKSIRRGQPSTLSAVAPQLPVGLRQLVDAALSPYPGARPHAMNRMGLQLEQHCTHYTLARARTLGDVRLTASPVQRRSTLPPNSGVMHKQVGSAPTERAPVSSSGPVSSLPILQAPPAARIAVAGEDPNAS